ncbi:MAG: hypothetical protein GY838_16955 [bacterium]|nr:hypothetical protein [bacterium]
MNRLIFATFLCALFLGSTLAAAQTTPATGRHVHAIQHFFQDTTLDTEAYGEGVFSFADFDAASAIALGAQASFPVADRFQLGGSLRFMSISPDEGDGQSGLMDPMVSGRYSFDTGTPTQVAAGAALTLPAGSEDIGQGNTDFALFGALRHPTSEKLSVMGRLSLNFDEQGEDRDSSLGLGGGLILAAKPNLHWIGELDFATEGDYGLMSFGVDHLLRSGGHIRGSLGLGLDDGAPDLVLQVGYLKVF